MTDARAGVGAGRVTNSGKRRARQTAEFVASSTAPTPTVEDVAEGHRLKDSTVWLARKLER